MTTVARYIALLDLTADFVSRKLEDLDNSFAKAGQLINLELMNIRSYLKHVESACAAGENCLGVLEHRNLVITQNTWMILTRSLQHTENYNPIINPHIFKIQI